MPVDPAKFIVRNLSYIQDADYPDACAKIAGDALKHDFANINELVNYIADDLTEHQGKHGFSRVHGNIRDQTPKPVANAHTNEWYTVLKARYRAPVARAMRKIRQLHAEGKLPGDIRYEAKEMKIGDTIYPPNEIARFFYEHDGQRIVLSELSLYEEPINHYLNQIRHPSTLARYNNDPLRPERSYEEEVRWSAISQSFTAAMHGKKSGKNLSPKERKDEAILCYSLLSHDMPLKGGSAALARIVLEYVSQKIGFEVPFTGRNYDLNLEAITRTPRDFVEAWHEGEFFDRDITAAEVLSWQKYAIDKQAKLPDDPQSYRSGL